jgi:hypothetical protein
MSGLGVRVVATTFQPLAWKGRAVSRPLVATINAGGIASVDECAGASRGATNADAVRP